MNPTTQYLTNRKLMMKKCACSDYHRISTVFKRGTVFLRGASIRMSLFNHIGSVKPGDLVEVTGQPMQVGDVSYWPGHDPNDNSARALRGVYLNLNNAETGSCEILIGGRVRSFWHPGVSVTLLSQVGSC